MSFELHSLKDRIGENRGNYFCCPYFCAGSSFLWGKFCEAYCFGILRNTVVNINIAFINGLFAGKESFLVIGLVQESKSIIMFNRPVSPLKKDSLLLLFSKLERYCAF